MHSTISSYYVQAVRTESRPKRQFGSNSLLFTPFVTVYVDSQPRVNELASILNFRNRLVVFRYNPIVDHCYVYYMHTQCSQTHALERMHMHTD